MTTLNDGYYIINNTTSGSIGTINLIGSSTAITGAGTSMEVASQTAGGGGGIRPPAERAKYSATLVFSYVKSKLTRIEQSRLKSRIARLQYLLETCDETEQFALKDELVRNAAIAIREQECAACGYDRNIDRKTIDRFRKDAKTRIDFDELEKFPRPIPENVRKKIQSVREKGLFDTLWVLYNNPSKEQVKSTKDKIIEKDPILFGTYCYAPDVFYFIADWIDEVCDLTFEQFIERVKAVDPGFDPETVTPLTLKDINAIKDRARQQHDRLKGTTPSNFRSLADQEMAEQQRGATGTPYPLRYTPADPIEPPPVGIPGPHGIPNLDLYPKPKEPKKSLWERIREWRRIRA